MPTICGKCGQNYDSCKSGMKLLKPDATTDGKIIFNFELNGKLKGEVITIIKEVPDYKKATLKAAKDEAVAEAKAKSKEKEEKKNKRETALAALLAAGIGEEEIVSKLDRSN